MMQVVDSILAGEPIRTIIVNACPGSGKSSLPAIASKLIPAIADCLLWIVPRKSLQHQAEQDFIDPFFRTMFGHTATIRSSTNEIDPCRGLQGFTTTYQAIAIDDSRSVLREASNRRYIVVLDEFHHVEKDGLWHKRLQPIIDRAAVLILMTGTLMRADGKPIAFVRYTDDGKPILNDSGRAMVINYSRKDALEEKAIIPIKFHFRDAQVSWKDELGQTVNYESMAAVKSSDVPKAIFTAIDTRYGQQLLDQAIEHWNEHRAFNPWSRLLVVTAGKKHADAALKYVRRKVASADIATSHESEAAQRAIKKFRACKIDTLVSIAMAHEGMSVKPITHICSLTHIRALGWLIQMLSRAVRVQNELEYDAQMAHVFAPDDPLMRSVVASIQAEQLPYLRKRCQMEQASLFEGEKNSNGGNRHGITPLESRMTSGRNYTLGGNPVVPLPVPKTPSEIESELRDAIEAHVRAYCRANYYMPQRINGEIRAAMNKPRAEMNRAELKHCLEHVRRVYPMHDQGSGTSAPRRHKRLFPTQPVKWGVAG